MLAPISKTEIPRCATATCLTRSGSSRLSRSERDGKRPACSGASIIPGLDVEELGSIYESLLDYHPQVLRDPWCFALTVGSQRKETGSYYTPPELVRVALTLASDGGYAWPDQVIRVWTAAALP